MPLGVRQRKGLKLLALMLTIACVGVVLAQTLYYFIYHGRWTVKANIQLYEDGIPISSIDFGAVPSGGFLVKDLSLRNEGNMLVHNVHLTLPDCTGMPYSISTTFVDQDMDIGAEVFFSIKIEDNGMVYGTTYEADFTFSCE